MTQIVQDEKIDDKNQFMKLGQSYLNDKKKEEGEDDAQHESDKDEQNCQKGQQPENDYRLPELVDYFGSKEVYRSNYQSMVNNLLKLCHQNFKDSIQTGNTKVSPESRELNEVISKAAVNSKAEKEQKELSRSRITLVQPPPDHRQFIDRMNKARRVSEQKRKMKLSYEMEKEEALRKKQEAKRKEEEENRRLQKQKILKQKMEEVMKRKQKQRQERIEGMKRFRSVFSEKRRHELMAQSYQTKVRQPLMQQRNKILQQRSKKFKGYSMDQIKIFQRQYLRKQQERASSSRKSKEQWQYNPPAIHPRLHQIIEEQKIRQRVKMQEKKRALQQKIARQQYYAQHLKQTITVTVDEKKKLELQKLNAKKQSRGKSKSQAIKMGNNYLAQVRGMVKQDKKDSYSTQQQPHKQESTTSKLKSNTSMGHYDYDKTIKEAHQKKISKLITSKQMQKGEKLQQLKVQVDKLSQRAKRKHQISKLKNTPAQNDTDMQLLLSSIKAKIGIMHLYKQ